MCHPSLNLLRSPLHGFQVLMPNMFWLFNGSQKVQCWTTMISICAILGFSLLCWERVENSFLGRMLQVDTDDGSILKFFNNSAENGNSYVCKCKSVHGLLFREELEKFQASNYSIHRAGPFPKINKLAMLGRCGSWKRDNNNRATWCKGSAAQEQAWGWQLWGSSKDYHRLRTHRLDLGPAHIVGFDLSNLQRSRFFGTNSEDPDFAGGNWERDILPREENNPLCELLLSFYLQNFIWQDEACVNTYHLINPFLLL